MIIKKKKNGHLIHKCGTKINLRVFCNALQPINSLLKMGNPFRRRPSWFMVPGFDILAHILC